MWRVLQLGPLCSLVVEVEIVGFYPVQYLEMPVMVLVLHN